MNRQFDRLADKYHLSRLPDHQLVNYGALGLANEFQRAAVHSPMNYQNMQTTVQMADQSPLSQEEMRQSLENMPSQSMQGYGHVVLDCQDRPN